ncbi:hypothetical protein [Rhizobium leguminosarum]|nr:hypothetical protein [Rhizobium leguminosarum]
MTAIALFKRVDRPFHLVMFDPRAKIDIGEGISQSARVDGADQPRSRPFR